MNGTNFTIVKNKTINKRIGEQIRLIRLSKNMSLEVLSDELNISLSTLSNLERGETEMTVTRLYDILLVLDYEVIDFFKLLLPDSSSMSVLSDSRERYLNPTELKFDQLEKSINELKNEMENLKKNRT